MTYRLSYDPETEPAQDALPPSVSEALTVALTNACDDPLGATHPYGMADFTIRQVIVDGAYAVLYVSHQSKTLHVTQIAPLP
ncbi:hypothetical protein [Streptomyces sp. MP131-18]|uniref:hypothetical protein n=1 Tax=Streptomyces sp. MP131-18 TaxID=1857892 RepID=UPI00097C785D|nr:hypothetical protein [Streptomyces sp. MP131-18]ONK09476.1 hypothetical protein STBA_01760 [Streptomyces sp. MP131-18]